MNEIKSVMPYAMDDEDMCDMIYDYSTIHTSAEGQALRGSSSSNDVANFVSKFGRDFLSRFANDMAQIFGPNAKVNCK